MYIDHTPPTHGPKGRVPGQVRPERVLNKAALTDQLDRAHQESSRDGNVTATNFWVTDGRLEVLSTTGEPFHVTEQATITGATWAYFASELRVDDHVVSHPMVWTAYAASPKARAWLLTQRLPLYRCMRMDTLRIMLANFYLFNGGWTYVPGDVLFATAWPGRVEAHYLREQDWYLPRDQWPTWHNRINADRS